MEILFNSRFKWKQCSNYVWNHRHRAASSRPNKCSLISLSDVTLIFVDKAHAFHRAQALPPNSLFPLSSSLLSIKTIFYKPGYSSPSFFSDKQKRKRRPSPLLIVPVIRFGEQSPIHVTTKFSLPNVTQSYYCFRAKCQKLFLVIFYVDWNLKVCFEIWKSGFNNLETRYRWPA